MKVVKNPWYKFGNWKLIPEVKDEITGLWDHTITAINYKTNEFTIDGEDRSSHISNLFWNAEKQLWDYKDKPCRTKLANFKEEGWRYLEKG